MLTSVTMTSEVRTVARRVTVLPSADGMANSSLTWTSTTPVSVSSSETATRSRRRDSCSRARKSTNCSPDALFAAASPASTKSP